MSEFEDIFKEVFRIVNVQPREALMRYQSPISEEEAVVHRQSPHAAPISDGPYLARTEPEPKIRHWWFVYRWRSAQK